VLTVVLPDTSEVRLVRDLRRHFMREDNVILLEDLWG
jgi:hypothetical protein